MAGIISEQRALLNLPLSEKEAAGHGRLDPVGGRLISLLIPLIIFAIPVNQAVRRLGLLCQYGIANEFWRRNLSNTPLDYSFGVWRLGVHPIKILAAIENVSRTYNEKILWA
jgi:hypothetical protein